MRIDKTFAYETYGPSDKGIVPAGKSSKAKSAQKGGADEVVISNAHGKYVSAALAAKDVNAAAVAEAKRLLEAGQLDAPEAVDRAAEAILDRGI